MIKSASCVPGHVSHFIDYFELSLLFSCTRGISQLEVIDPHMLWENILVCVQAAFWICADPVFQVPHYVFPWLSRAWWPQLINPMYFCLDYTVLLCFAFILFPWWFSHGLAREIGGWWLTPACLSFCFCSRKYVDLATSFFISYRRASVHLRTEQIIVKQQNIASVLMRTPPIPLIHSRGFNELRPSALPWSISVPGNSLREACCMPIILACSFLILE